MSDMEVRIVQLEPLRVAAAQGFGTHPEHEAWRRILAWADGQGLRIDEGRRFFGFNHPNPSPGSPNYGYEQWMTIGPGEPEAGGGLEPDIEIKRFAGGKYAVTRSDLANVGATWRRLVTWLEDSPHFHGTHQCLEEAITPPRTPESEVVLDLYLPIRG